MKIKIFNQFKKYYHSHIISNSLLILIIPTKNTTLPFLSSKIISNPLQQTQLSIKLHIQQEKMIEICDIDLPWCILGWVFLALALAMLVVTVKLIQIYNIKRICSHPLYDKSVLWVLLIQASLFFITVVHYFILIPALNILFVLMEYSQMIYHGIIFKFFAD